MKLHNVKPAGAAWMLALALGLGAQPAVFAATVRPVELPPSADLQYDISARQRGLSLKGEATVHWRAAEGKYSVRAVSRVAMFGTLSDDRSEGVIDSQGLAPVHFSEKRLRKPAMTVEFDRASRTVQLAEGSDAVRLQGGEQDRVSVTWQLAGLARAAGSKLQPGATLPIKVAGRRTVDNWQFKVVGKETIQTGIGKVETVHLRRDALQGGRDQEIEVWLAPKHQWYPVKVRFTEGDKETIEQTLSSIAQP